MQAHDLAISASVIYLFMKRERVLTVVGEILTRRSTFGVMAITRLRVVGRLFVGVRPLPARRSTRSTGSSAYGCLNGSSVCEGLFDDRAPKPSRTAQFRS